MSVSHISASTQSYLKAIWTLGEWSDEPVTATTIAQRVGVKLSTASDAVRKLTDQGLLEHSPYGAVTLTEQGRIYALEMVRRHRLIETFLVDVLDYTWDQVHDEAEALEHAVSDFLIERIDTHLGFPQRDPHGDPIPQENGTVPRIEAIRLSELAFGTSARVERVADADSQLLEFLAERGLVAGSDVVTAQSDPYSGAINVFVSSSDTPISLGRNATDAIWVTPAEKSQ